RPIPPSAEHEGVELIGVQVMVERFGALVVRPGEVPAMRVGDVPGDGDARAVRFETPHGFSDAFGFRWRGDCQNRDAWIRGQGSRSNESHFCFLPSAFSFEECGADL